MPATIKSQKKTQKKKPVLSVKSKRKTKNPPTDRDYQEMIAEAAYYKAEQRGFAPGYEGEDWLQAEIEIMSMLKKH